VPLYRLQLSCTPNQLGNPLLFCWMALSDLPVLWGVTLSGPHGHRESTMSILPLHHSFIPIFTVSLGFHCYQQSRRYHWHYTLVPSISLALPLVRKTTSVVIRYCCLQLEISHIVLNTAIQSGSPQLHLVSVISILSE